MRADAIVDREEELRRLTYAVRNGERLFLIGPRRHGKTSLLNYMQSELEREGVTVLKDDVEQFETTRLLAQALLTGAIRALTGPVDKISALAGRQIKRFFGSLKPELSYDVGEETGSVSVLGDRRTEAASLPLLTDVLDGIEAMAASRKQTVAVVLDEFQQLVGQHGTGAIAANSYFKRVALDVRCHRAAKHQTRSTVVSRGTDNQGRKVPRLFTAGLGAETQPHDIAGVGHVPFSHFKKYDAAWAVL